MDFPILPKEVVDINQQLVEHFGIDSISGQPMWRVSWSNDQYEKRLTDCTSEGFHLLYPEVRELPKYQWVRDRWILEQLVLVPDIHLLDLPTQKQSYECMHVFQDRFENALPPKFWACKFTIDCVYAAKGKSSLAKYVDPEATQEAAMELKQQRVNQLVEELYGNESDLLGRTVTGEAVGYTGGPTIDTSQKKES